MPIRVYDKETQAPIAEIAAEQLAALQGAMEEEFAEDRDYYLTADTLDYLLGEGVDAGLVAQLRTALGSRDGFDVIWRTDT